MPDIIKYMIEEVKSAKKKDHKEALVEFVFYYLEIYFYQ